MKIECCRNLTNFPEKIMFHLVNKLRNVNYYMDTIGHIRPVTQLKH